MKILIVDDNPINLKLLFYSLKNRHQILMANDGLEALKILEAEHCDIVLMDLSMPVMDGAEATLQIRKSELIDNKNIPIIFVTTNDYENERERCIGYGANDYLIKPVDTEELMKVLDYHVNQK